MTAALAPILPKQWVGFIDNQAGHAALLKGWGADERVNLSLLIECFWKFAATSRWQPHFEWVPSHSNIADPISRGGLKLAESHGWKHVVIDDQPPAEAAGWKEHHHRARSPER